DTVSINKACVIAGSYQDSSNDRHGFVRATDGTITTFDPPNSTATYVTGLNDSSEIAGSYSDRGNTVGFVRKANGKIIKIELKGSNDVGASAINNDGVVTGAYCCVTGSLHGFVRAADGTIKTFTVKGSVGIAGIGG